MGNNSSSSKTNETYDLKISNIMEKLYNLILSKNHTCAKIDTIDEEPVLLWCQQYPCENLLCNKERIKQQKELEEFELELEKTHSCVKRDEDTYPMKLTWCQQTECIEQQNKKLSPTLPPKPQRHPQLMDKMYGMLQDEHHSCMRIKPTETSHTFDWCQYGKCNIAPKQVFTEKQYEDMQKRNDSAEIFANNLKNNGHTCVSYMETYPVRIRWCNQTQCINKGQMSKPTLEDQ